MRTILPFRFFMENNSELTPRVATFFLLLAIGLMVLFVGSVMADEAQCIYFLLSLAAGFLSFFFYRRSPKPPPSGRFSGLRKLRERRQKRLEEKRQKQQQKKK
ncbi:MAG: hypothetical protein ABWK53_02140 [Anaerolineales bacterium]